MTALIAFLASGLAALGLICAGVFVLAGTGWALIASGVSMMCVAVFLRQGLSNG